MVVLVRDCCARSTFADLLHTFTHLLKGGFLAMSLAEKDLRGLTRPQDVYS